MVVIVQTNSKSGPAKRTLGTLGGVPISVLALALATVALYAMMIDWGLPYATAANRIKTFAIDDVLPLGALAEMRSTLVAPGPNRTLNYPWLHYFVTACAQAPYVAYLKLTRQLTSPARDYPYGFRDPVAALRALTWIGRLLTVLMAAGVVIASWKFSSILWGDRAGLIAALLAPANYLMFYYGRTGNPDVPALFWIACGLVAYAGILKDRITAKRAALLAVFSALALATKDQAAVVFLPLGCLLLLPGISGIPAWRERLRVLVILFAVGLGAYVAAAGMLIDPARHIGHVRHILSSEWRTIATAGGYWPSHPATLAGALSLGSEFVRRLADALSLPLLIAALLGIGLAARTSRRMLVLLTPFLALLLLLTLPTRIVVLRYFLPCTLIVGSFAAFALASVRQAAVRSLLVVLCLGAAVAPDIELAYEQRHDPRYAASEWLREHARPGMRVEYFGAPESLPHLEPGVVSRHVAGAENWEADAGYGPAVLEYLIREGPDFVVMAPDWTSRPGMLRSATCPREVYEALESGLAGYHPDAQFDPPRLLPSEIHPPDLDYPHAPPVRIYTRVIGPHDPT